MSSTLTGEEARRKLYEIMASDRCFEYKANRALSIGREYLGVENGHLTRIDPENDYWKAIYSTDSANGQFPPGLILDLGGTYCRHTVDQDPVRLYNAPEQGFEDDPGYENHGIETYHGTALMIDDEPYGSVCFVSRDARETQFSEDETMFAELISRMIEYEIKQERTKETVERLDQFASVVSHDLRNPLGIAQGNVELLRQRCQDSEELDATSRALDRMEELIEDVLSLARQSQEVEETESISLRTVSDDCWTTVDTPDADLEIAADYAFIANRHRVKRLFENIFRNAVEHGGSEIVIRVGPLPDADGFYVENSGKPIPAAEREEIFETGFSTGTDGLGLGLAIVKGIITAHGWNISVTDSSLGGPRFEIAGVIAA